jgi:hypothetical protein
MKNVITRSQGTPNIRVEPMLPHVVPQTLQPITTWLEGMAMPLIGWPIPHWPVPLGWLVPSQFNLIATNSTSVNIQQIITPKLD